MKYSKDGQVVFNPENHTYWRGETQLIGVTTWLSQFKNKFDSDKIAEAYAKKHKRDKEEVLAEWKAESERSTVHGTSVHKVFEDFHETGNIIKGGISPKEDVAERFIKDFFHSGRLSIVEAEMLVHKGDIASQIDCIVKNPKGEYFILDWKTNKKIDYDSFRGQTFMKNPFDMYPDCNYYHYSMQMKAYERMCTEYPISGSYIVHIGSKDYTMIKPHNVNLFDLI